MAGELPEGLLETRQEVVGEIGRFELLEFGDIWTLWSVYSGSRTTAAGENVGRRLENLFWRIMSSARLLRTMSGEQLALQFKLIHENPYIRTTPRNSPRSSRNLGGETDSDLLSQVRTPPVSSCDDPGLQLSNGSSDTKFVEQVSSKNAKPAVEPEDDEEALTPTPSSPFTTAKISSSIKDKNQYSSETAKTRPILKQSYSRAATDASGSGGASSSASISHLSDGINASFGSSPRAARHTATRFSDEVSVSFPKTSSSVPKGAARRGGKDTSYAGSKKGSVFIASTSASKRKPVMVRQRSSQSASFKGSTSPPSSGTSWRSSKLMSATDQHAPTQPNRELGKSLAGAENSSRDASSFWVKRPLGDSPRHETMASCPDLAVEDNPPNRVEQEAFRPRYFPNPSKFGRKARAASATAASYQASGLLEVGQPLAAVGHSQGTDAFQQEDVALRAQALASPGTMQGNTETPPPPRTKGQLSLLLERVRSGREQPSTATEQERKLKGV